MRSVLKLVASVSLVAAAMVACSGGEDSSSSPTPPSPPQCDTQWAAAKVVIQNNCIRCHDGVIKFMLLPQSAFDARPVRAVLTAGRMPPPPATLSAADKATLNAYLTCSGK